jgi:hypothetical protein
MGEVYSGVELGRVSSGAGIHIAPRYFSRAQERAYARKEKAPQP